MAGHHFGGGGRYHDGSWRSGGRYGGTGYTADQLPDWEGGDGGGHGGGNFAAFSGGSAAAGPWGEQFGGFIFGCGSDSSASGCT